MYQIATYCLFLLFAGYITVYVGHMFYKNGAIFLHGLLPQNEALINSINKLLLLGYYLINLGAVVINLSFWENISSIQMVLESVLFRTGLISLMLALLHYNNLFWLYLFSLKQRKKLVAETDVKLNT